MNNNREKTLRTSRDNVGEVSIRFIWKILLSPSSENLDAGSKSKMLIKKLSRNVHIVGNDNTRYTVTVVTFNFH